jgi:hypothetical protein
MMRRLTPLQIAGSALALLAAASVSSAPAQEVGKASAVNPAATANMRTISIGSSIAHKERIRTEANGSVQLLFVDKTSMTIGPNSDLTIDEYVYNPNAGSGKLAATLSKGALRFVGGQISHSGDAEVKTASAVIGIRGGVALIGMHHVFAGYGSSTVTTGGSTVTLGAGEYIDIPGGGAPPSPPGPPPPGFVLGQITLFQSGSGQTGGAARGSASPANVARAESRATGSNGGSVAGALTPSPPVQTLPPINTAASNLTQTIQSTVQTAAAETIVDNSPATTLIGYIGGLMHSSLGDRGATTAFIGTSQVLLDPAAKRVQANFAGANIRAYGDGYTPQTFSYQLGSVDPAENPNSQYVDANNFGARAAIGKNGKPVSTIDGAPITDHSADMIVVSADTVRQYAGAAGVGNLTPCSCDYTKWGLWVSDSKQNVGGSVYRDQVAGFWVAGRAINASDVPHVGSASYEGHVIAAIQNGSQNYVASGSLTTTVNFGSQSGTAAVTGFDGLNYYGSLLINPNDPRNLYAGLSSTAGGNGMLLDGQFLRGKTSPVGEMGGTALVNGTNYLGSGIFAAKMK